jgi:hypothetical protein
MLTGLNHENTLCKARSIDSDPYASLKGESSQISRFDICWRPCLAHDQQIIEENKSEALSIGRTSGTTLGAQPRDKMLVEQLLIRLIHFFRSCKISTEVFTRKLRIMEHISTAL